MTPTQPHSPTARPPPKPPNNNTSRTNPKRTPDTRTVRLPKPNRWRTTKNKTKTDQNLKRPEKTSLPPPNSWKKPPDFMKNTTSPTTNTKTHQRSLAPTDPFRKYLQVDVRIPSTNDRLNYTYAADKGIIKIRKYVEAKIRGVTDIPPHLLPYIHTITHKGDSTPLPNGTFKRSFTILFLSTHAHEHIYNVRARARIAKKKTEEKSEKAETRKKKARDPTALYDTDDQQESIGSISKTSDEEGNPDSDEGNTTIRKDTRTPKKTTRNLTGKSQQTGLPSLDSYSVTSKDTYTLPSPRSEAEEVFISLTKGREYPDEDGSNIILAEHPLFWRAIDFFCKEKMWLDTSPLTHENPDPTARHLQFFVPPCNAPNSQPHALLIGLPLDIVGRGQRQTRKINWQLWALLAKYLPKGDPWCREVNYNNSIGLRASESLDGQNDTSHFTIYVCNEQAGTKFMQLINKITNNNNLINIWNLPVMISKIPSHGNDQDSWGQYNATRKIQKDIIAKRNTNMALLPLLRTNLIEGRKNEETIDKILNLQYVLTVIPNYNMTHTNPTATILFNPQVTRWMRQPKPGTNLDSRKIEEKFLVNTLPQEVFNRINKTTYRPEYLAINNPANIAKTMEVMAESTWKDLLNRADRKLGQKQLQEIMKNNAHFEQSQPTPEGNWEKNEDELHLLSMLTTDYDTVISLDDHASFLTTQGDMPPPNPTTGTTSSLQSAMTSGRFKSNIFKNEETIDFNNSYTMEEDQTQSILAHTQETSHNLKHEYEQMEIDNNTDTQEANETTHFRDIKNYCGFSTQLTMLPPIRKNTQIPSTIAITSPTSSNTLALRPTPKRSNIQEGQGNTFDEHSLITAGGSKRSRDEETNLPPPSDTDHETETTDKSTFEKESETSSRTKERNQRREEKKQRKNKNKKKEKKLTKHKKSADTTKQPQPTVNNDIIMKHFEYMNDIQEDIAINRNATQTNETSNNISRLQAKGETAYQNHRAGNYSHLSSDNDSVTSFSKDTAGTFKTPEYTNSPLHPNSGSEEEL